MRYTWIHAINEPRNFSINYPILQADPERQYNLLKQWGNPFGVLPFTVIIGKDGHLVFMQQGIFNKGNYSAAENYRNITLRAVMIFYSPIGSRDSKIS